MCNLALGQTIFSDRIHKVNNNHASLSLNCANNFFGIKEKSQFIFHTQTLEFQRFKRHSSNQKMYKAQFSRLNFKTSRLLFLSRHRTQMALSVMLGLLVLLWNQRVCSTQINGENYNLCPVSRQLDASYLSVKSSLRRTNKVH